MRPPKSSSQTHFAPAAGGPVFSNGLGVCWIKHAALPGPGRPMPWRAFATAAGLATLPFACNAPRLSGIKRCLGTLAGRVAGLLVGTANGLGTDAALEFDLVRFKWGGSATGRLELPCSRRCSKPEGRFLTAEGMVPCKAMG
jgi:hypothetical protein